LSGAPTEAFRAPATAACLRRLGLAERLGEAAG
jgi:hypothetical protein